MSDSKGNAVPSAWPPRQLRREAAIARDRAQTDERFKSLEGKVVSMDAKLDEIQKKIAMVISRLDGDSTMPAMYPPGLHEGHFGMLIQRVDRLEAILTLDPPSQLEPSVSKVLDALLLERIDENSAPRQEPDAENTPEKQRNINMFDQANFEAYDDIDAQHCDVDGGEKSRHEISDALPSLVAQAQLIADEIRTEGQMKLVDQKFGEYVDFVCARFREIIATCPREPLTKLTRTDFEEKYMDMHRHSVWKRICQEHFEGTGDPLSKSDALLDLAFVIHSISVLP